MSVCDAREELLDIDCRQHLGADVPCGILLNRATGDATHDIFRQSNPLQNISIDILLNNFEFTYRVVDLTRLANLYFPLEGSCFFFFGERLVIGAGVGSDPSDVNARKAQ